MMTCRLTHCSQVGKCRLEETGAIDLCPVLRQIVEDARRQTEAAWAHKFPVHEVVTLEHYEGTRTVNCVGFTLAMGLGRIVALHLAREKATLEKIAYEKEHKIILIDPKPRPEWGRQAKVRKLRIKEQRSGMDFHEMPTLIQDYCAYPPLDHVEDIEAKELKAKADVTKLQKRRWQDYSAKKKIIAKRMRNHNYYMQMEDRMNIKK